MSHKNRKVSIKPYSRETYLDLFDITYFWKIILSLSGFSKYDVQENFLLLLTVIWKNFVES